MALETVQVTVTVVGSVAEVAERAAAVMAETMAADPVREGRRQERTVAASAAAAR